MSGDNNNRDSLREIGGVPNLPTRKEFNALVAKIEPGTLQRAKTQLKETWKHKRDTEQPVKLIRSEELPVNDELHRTRVLEMELLKLKGEFRKNKTCTKHLIKKLSNEREMVNDSIKELSMSRKEELGLVEVIKRDNVELMEQKRQLELELVSQTERMELILSTLVEAETYLKEKDERLQALELERFEMSKKIETLELKLKLTEYESESAQKSGNFDWNHYLTTHLACPLKSILWLALCAVILFILYRISSTSPMTEPYCKDCDYERDIYMRIQT